MVKSIVGIQKIEYDKKDGTGHVSGVNIFIASDIPSDRGTGIAVEREYLGSSKVPDDLCLGDWDIEYAKSYTGSAYIERLTKI